MKLWDNDLRNIYKKPELHAYYGFWGAVRSGINRGKKLVNDTVNKGKKLVNETVDKGKELANDAVDKGKEIGSGIQDFTNDLGTLTGYGIGKLTEPIGGFIEDRGNDFGNFMQKTGELTGLAPIINEIGERSGLKKLGQNIHAGFQYGAGIMPEEEEASSEEEEEEEGGDDQGNQTKAETDKAETEAAGAGGSAEREAANSAREAGVNSSRSGMLAGANNQAAGLLNGLYQTGAAQNAATQEDYINKMARADVMDTKARNVAKGAQIMPWASAMQGFGTGTQLGMSLMPSDENVKEAADGIDDNKLNESIAQFKSLYKRLQELKEKQ